MIQILIYAVVFLLAGYLSYTLIISKEVKKLQSARTEYKKEKIILKVLEERAQRINAIANNAQKLETELINIRSRVFNEDNDVLSFMRSLPATTNMTGNNLMSITPLGLKPILEAPPPPPPPSSKPVEGKATTAQSPPPTPRNLPCKIKPVEVSFIGGYGDVIRFFDELKRTGQYVKVDNISLVGGSENSGQVSVKVVLNLLQMEVDVRTPPKQIAEITQKTIVSTGTALVNQNATAGGSNANIATPVQTPAQITIAVKPVQKVAPIQIAKLLQSAVKPAQKVTPVQTAKLLQSVAKPSQTVASILSSQTTKPVGIAVRPTRKVMPVQTAKQPQFVEKPIQKVESTPPIQTAKQNGKIIQYAVRVGIFSYYENAENLAKTLKTHQYNAWIKPYSYRGKTTYWGVYVGSFETKDKAVNFAESMQQKLSYIDDFVIDVNLGIRRNS
jgi:cell division septation protein DedD